MEERIIKGIQSKCFLTAFSVSLVMIFALGWIVFVRNDTLIREIDVDPDIIVDDHDLHQYHFKIEELVSEKDNISITKDYLKIKGWLVCNGEATQSASIKIVFQDVTTGKYYLIPTQMDDRDDVTQEMNDGNNYRYSGFSVNVPYINELEDDSKDYKLFALYQLNSSRVLLPFNTTLKTWK